MIFGIDDLMSSYINFSFHDQLKLIKDIFGEPFKRHSHKMAKHTQTIRRQ